MADEKAEPTTHNETINYRGLIHINGWFFLCWFFTIVLVQDMVRIILKSDLAAAMVVWLTK